MRKILTLSIISSILLIAGNPIHDLMDNRIKGKSYSGSLDDNTAAEDGLGILPLSSYSMTTDQANELLVQKILSDIERTETDKTKTVNIKDGLTAGTVGTANDLTLFNKYISASSSGIDLSSYLSSNATSTGTVGYGVGGYGFGTFWADLTQIAGAHHFDASGPGIYVIKSNDNQNYIAYSTFTDNPWTGGYNFRPTEVWLNGKNLIANGNILESIKSAWGSNAVIDYTWSSTNQSVFLNNSTYYYFANPTMTLQQLSTPSVSTADQLSFEYNVGTPINSNKNIQISGTDSFTIEFKLELTNDHTNTENTILGQAQWASNSVAVQTSHPYLGTNSWTTKGFVFNLYQGYMTVMTNKFMLFSDFGKTNGITGIFKLVSDGTTASLYHDGVLKQSVTYNGGLTATTDTFRIGSMSSSWNQQNPSSASFKMSNLNMIVNGVDVY